MKYDKLIIYYFSGTGNAKNTSLWIIKVAEERGLKTHLINIARFKKIDIPELTEKTLIGFCSPTHGFNMPPIVLKFIRKFPKTKNVDAFILNTRGGLKLYNFFLPGLSGIAQLLPALMLWLKGFCIVGMQPLDLPSNWLILHPGLRKKTIESIYNRCKKIVDGFANRLLDGRKKYKAFLSLPFDLAIIPISVGYYFIGRFILAKTLVASDACNNCGLCISKCPVEAINLVNDRPFWSYTCESCMRCVNECPHRAIETTHSFLALLILVASGVISPMFAKLLEYFNLLDLENQLKYIEYLWSVILTFIFVMFTFLSYRILHFLMKYIIINKIITYSSLSKYKFWRRYKAPKSY